MSKVLYDGKLVALSEAKALAQGEATIRIDFSHILLDRRNIYASGCGDSFAVTIRKNISRRLGIVSGERVEIILSENGDIIIRRLEFQNASKELYKKETEGQRPSISAQSRTNHAATTQSDKQ